MRKTSLVPKSTAGMGKAPWDLGDTHIVGEGRSWLSGHGLRGRRVAGGQITGDTKRKAETGRDSTEPKLRGQKGGFQQVGQIPKDSGLFGPLVHGPGPRLLQVKPWTP